MAKRRQYTPAAKPTKPERVLATRMRGGLSQTYELKGDVIEYHGTLDGEGRNRYDSEAEARKAFDEILADIRALSEGA